jgi:peptidoglycan/LPS O-acetylase OafA/YrhL
MTAITSTAATSTATTSTATRSTITASAAANRRAASLPRTTLTCGVGAAALSTAVAAAVHAGGVPLAVDGGMIPLAGFAQMTFLGAIIGGVLLAVLNRCSDVPRLRFLQAAVGLTALSCLPSVTMPPDVATQVSLVALHVLAAVMIVPFLAHHAND